MGRFLNGEDARERRIRAFLTLRLLPGVGDRAVQRLLERFGTAERAVGASRADFARWTSRAAAAERDRADMRNRVEAVMRGIERLKLTTLVLGMDGYPEALNELFDPPTLLFLKGDLRLLERRAVAIVGARKASGYGRRASAALAADLAAHDVVVVSGLALGIDAAAHRGALDVGGGTIAVLGSGLDLPYPPSNRGLFREIGRTGLLVSEFLPGESALPHHFPRRNRIIAALSSGVVVIEAGQKSGSLITVEHAIDLGRDVFALPGSVESAQSAGTNALIRDGAYIVTDVADILKELEWKEAPAGPAEPASEPPAELGEDARRLWLEMRHGVAHLDDLLERSGLNSARGMAAISLLELSGWAVQEPGRKFTRHSISGTFGHGADA